MNTADLTVRLYKLILSGEHEQIGDLLAPEFHVVEADGLPYAGVYSGLEGICDLLERVSAVWGNPDARIEQIIPGPTSAAAILTLSGHRPGVGMVSSSICEVWEFDAGRATRCRPFYWDTAYVAAFAKVDAGNVQ